MNQKKPKFLGYKRIPWNQIVRCPLNPRTDYGNLTELQDTIIADGILDDLVVRPVDGKYEVVCGERRRQAGQTVTKDAPCKVYEMSDEIARRWMAIEDYQKEIWRPYERGKFYVEWIVSEKLTSKELASIIGCSESKIKDYTSFARKISSEVGPLVATATIEGKSESKTLTFGKARQLTTLEQPVQKALAKRVMTDGMTEKEVSKQIDEIKAIQADISKCEDEKLKAKVTETYLKPEKLVKTEAYEVKLALGYPTEPAEKWREYPEVKKKILTSLAKIPEITWEENEEKRTFTIFYKEKPKEEEE